MDQEEPKISGNLLEKEKKSFMSHLDDVLLEVGISRKQFVLLVIFIIVFLVSLVVFVYFLYQYFTSDKKINIKVSKPAINESINPRSLDTGDMIGFKNFGFKDVQPNLEALNSGWILSGNLYVSSYESGVLAGMIVSEEAVYSKENMSTLRYGITVLAKNDNVLSVDVETLLSESSDRGVALEDYLTKLKDAYKESVSLQSELRLLLEKLKTEFEFVSTEKTLKEKEFFDNISVYSSLNSETVLDDFIELAKNQTGIKANFQALSKIKTILDVHVKKMEARISGIELNKEALKFGIKIVPVVNSGINLVEIK